MKSFLSSLGSFSLNKYNKTEDVMANKSFSPCDIFGHVFGKHFKRDSVAFNKKETITELYPG